MYGENHPYVLSNRTITDRQNYLERDFQFRKLLQNVRYGINTVILGPEGIGKTQFLNTAFNRRTKMELAEQDRILVSRFDSVAGTGANEFFYAIADGVRRAADVLSDLGDPACQAAYARIIRKAKERNEAASNGASYLQSLCNIFEDEEYQVVLVMDQFEQFVNSRHVSAEHHDVLRALLANDRLRLVVATDYDLNYSTLPQAAAGSLLFQLFSGHEITLPGLSAAGCKALLLKMHPEEVFNDEEIDRLTVLSAGIPPLLCNSANQAYAQKQSSGEIDWRKVREEALRASNALLSRWAQHLNEKQVAFLKGRAAQGQLTQVKPEIEDDCLGPLCNRGLVRDDYDKEPKFFEITSVLFRDYCRYNDLIPYQEEALETVGGTQTINYIDKFYSNGAVDQSQTIKAENIMVAQGVTMKELVGWIANPTGTELGTGGYQQILGSTLSSRFNGYLTESILPAQGTASGDEYALVCDAHFSEIGSKLLPDIQVNEDNEAIIDIEPEELVTIDKRFSEVRNRRPNLTDAILDAQSERCQLYIKLSVIVEDALAVVGPYVEDYSPQLVLYGKALEQALRDNFYGYFSTEETLKVFDPHRKYADAASKNAFQNIDRERSFIGNYYYMIKENRQYLSDRCVKHGISAAGKTQTFYEWKNWWWDLQTAIFETKNLRNLADHASSCPPEKENLDTMCDLLFGSQDQEGVLPRLTVGLDLLLHLNAGIDAEMVHTLENSECDVVVTKIKSQNALDCSTEDGRYVVKISKNVVNEYLAAHAEVQLYEGMHLTAMLGLYHLQDGKHFFHGKIASVPVG